MQNGDFNLSENEHQTYVQFIGDILQLVKQNPTPENLYPYLKQNRSKLNDTFHQILIEWINSILQNEVTPQVLQDFGIILGNFGYLLSDFPLGITSINKEIVITCYQKALTIFSRDTTPEMWAIFQDKLGTAYFERIKGNKSENLGIAINSFKNALKVYLFDQFPQEWIRNQYNLAFAYDDANNQEMAITVCNELLNVVKLAQNPYKWADTQNILGNAYRKRTKGDKNTNLAEAITAFNDALRVYNREKFPQKWAEIQANLAVVYRNKTGKDYAENLEVAIKKYEEALQVITFTNSPQEWATIQDNLGVAYSHRIEGDKAKNLDRAISAHLEALKVPQSDYKWAMVQSNMGNAYRDKINLVKEQKNKLDNFNKAVECFKNALRIWNRENFPQEWVKCQNNLGIISTFHIDLFSSEDDQNKAIENGIVTFQDALEVCSQNNYSIEWANLQDNLASAYAKRISGNEIRNLEMSISHYQEALKVRTFESYPYEWAKTQNNLGGAYSKKIRKGDVTTENLELAIQSFHRALEIRTPKTVPLECLTTRSNLGNVYYREKQWHKAIESYIIAIEIIEDSRLQSLDEKRRQEIIAENIDVYENIIQSLVQIGDIDKALEYVESSRSRRLADIMNTKDTYPDTEIPERVQLWEVRQQLSRRLNDLISNRIQLDNPSDDKLLSKNQDARELSLDTQRQQTKARNSAINADIEKLERELSELDLKIRAIDSRFADQIQPPHLDVNKLQALIPDNQTAIVSFFTTKEDTHIFIVRKTGNIQLLTCEGQGLNELQSYLWENWLIPYFDKDQGKIFLAGKLLKRRYQEIKEVEIVTINDEKNPDKQQQVVQITFSSENEQPIILKSESLDKFLQASDEISDKVWRTKIKQVTKKLAQTLQIDKLVSDEYLGDEIKQLILVPHLYLHIIPLSILPITPPSPPLQSVGNSEKAQQSPLSRGDADRQRGKDLEEENIEVPFTKENLGESQSLESDNHNPPQHPLKSGEKVTLGDKYIIRTLPSCLTLKFCSEYPPVDITKTAIVENATDDLVFTSYECHQIKEFYQESREINQLTGSQEVTIKNYLHLLEKEQVNHLHTSHHATSRVDKPHYSALNLGDGDVTLADLLFMRLPDLSLVFLSCCETALGINLQARNDEILTIAGGFLTAGARTVISTLWAVNDLATALFSLFFYQELELEIPPIALKKAQEKLRSLTGEEMQKYIPEIINIVEPKLKANIKQLGELEGKLKDEIKEKSRQFKKYDDNSSEEKQELREEIEKLEKAKSEKINKRLKLKKRKDNLKTTLDNLASKKYPFQHPYNWAGFVCQGLD